MQRTAAIAGIVMIFGSLLSVYTYSGEKETADSLFEQAMRLPEDPHGLLKKEQLYVKVLHLLPNNAATYNNLGDVYEKEGRYEEAIAQYKKALDLEPKAAYPYFGLGDVHFSMGDFKEAGKWYDKGLIYDPEDQITQSRVASIRELTGEQKQQTGSAPISAEILKRILTLPQGQNTRVIGKKVTSITFREGLIPFDRDKYDIREEAKPQLNELGKALQDRLGMATRDIAVRTWLVEIAGHTDEPGSDEYNLRLSLNRANAVTDYLIKNFRIPKEKLDPRGYGNRVPLSHGTLEASRALNRRVEVAIKDRATSDGITTRAISYRDQTPQTLTMEMGLTKGVLLLKPLQNCCAYILQEGAANGIVLLYPEDKGSAGMEKGKEYKILNGEKTQGKIYVLVTSWLLESEFARVSLKDQAWNAVKGLMSRSIRITEQSKSQERIEGDGAWVRIVKF